MAFSKQLKYRSSSFQFNSLLEKFVGEKLDVPILSDENEKKLSSISKIIKPNKRKNDMVPFSFDEFKSELKEYTTIKEEDRAFFTNVACMYDFKLSEMMNILYRSEKDGSYDKELYIDNAYKHYKEKNPKIIKSDDEKSKEHIEYFKKTTIQTLLEANKDKLSEADVNTIRRLYDELGLDDSFITLLIIYSLSTNNNKISAFKYYETIVNDWKDKKINTVEDAYYYICTLYSREFKTKKIDMSNEEWVDNYWKNVDINNVTSVNKKWVDDFWANFDENKDKKSKNQTFVDNYWDNFGKENKK